jgi:hypothetical protein
VREEIGKEGACDGLGREHMRGGGGGGQEKRLIYCFNNSMVFKRKSQHVPAFRPMGGVSPERV